MQADEVLVYVDGRAIRVPAGASAVAALVLAGQMCTRRSVSGDARFALCGMGQCQECRVTIDGRAHRLACQVRCHSGMAIVTGAAEST
ncbi:MAG: 2Fe-2S iron-sulfur cluster-binding protein [Massilia sp.]